MRRLLNQAATRSQNQRKHLRDRVSPRGPAPGTQSSHWTIAHRQCRLIWLILHQEFGYGRTGPSGHKRSRTRTSKMLPATPKPRLIGSNHRILNPAKDKCSVFFRPDVLPPRRSLIDILTMSALSILFERTSPVLRRDWSPDPPLTSAFHESAQAAIQALGTPVQRRIFVANGLTVDYPRTFGLQPGGGEFDHHLRVTSQAERSPLARRED